MRTLSVGNCLTQDAYFCPKYFDDPYRRATILADLRTHVSVVAQAVVLGLVIAVPLALAVRRRRIGRGLAIGTTGVLYTVPSVAAFAVLSVYLPPPHDYAVVVVLTAYALLILLRNTLAGLDGVPPETVEAARGLGFSRTRTVLRVELPLALPSIVAGLRIATVSTIGITAVGSLFGLGGLGQLIYEGQNDSGVPFHPEIATGLVLSVVLALVADGLLLGVQRALSRWQRAGRQA